MKRYQLASSLVFALLILLMSASIAPTVDAQNSQGCFTETPKCINQAFLPFWRDNGGLPIYGFPISDTLTKNGLQAQWFERNRFESHPENSPPYNILLGRLGDERLKQLGRDWHNEPNNGNPLGGTCETFSITQRDVCGPFLEYWHTHGLLD